MTIQQIQEAIRAKTLEMERAVDSGQPQDEVVKLYKELKELQYQKIQLEVKAEAE